MDDRFAEHRNHLRAVAYRLLGSMSDADDAVQEAWLRLSRSDTAEVENLRGWLTTVVARVSLDMLRARRTRRLEPLDERLAGPADADPEQQAILAEAVGLALLVVLDRLTPAERVAFVLHDVFAVPFEEIAPVVGRTPAAARQLASRARRRVQGEAAVPEADPGRRRALVDAFLAAARSGDFSALLAVLDPSVMMRADPAAVRLGATREVRGADALVGFFAGRAQGARRAVLDGEPGAAWVVGGRPRVAFAFTISEGRVAAIELIADPERLGRMDIVLLDA